MLSRQTSNINVCNELLDRRRPRDVTDISRYGLLYSSGRKLISNWLKRAWVKRDCKPKDSFEPFIFTWISFNGWASCVTDLDKDREWLDALIVHQQVNDDFARLAAKSGSPLFQYARDFQQLWPIFKVQEIRRRRVNRWYQGQRPAIVQNYLAAGLTQYEPRCWKRHRDEGNPVPLDWPHTLEALYRVRCNLFHGEKDPYSEVDSQIVSTAFHVLVYFLHDANYIPV